MTVRDLQQPRGWAYNLAVAVVKPTLLATTTRTWRGGENVPATGGCIVVFNHVSHMDPLTAAHFLYDHGRLPRYLAKSGLFKNKALGRFLRAAGQIPVERLSRSAKGAYDAAVAAVRAGECVVVYPEGTISRDPGLWPMTGKTGAARIALSTGCPVVPIAQWGANHLLEPYTTRPKLFPRKTITMKAGDPVDLDDLRAQPLTPDVLKQATTRIMDALAALLGDVRGEQPPATRFDPRTAGVKEIGNPHADRPERRSRNRAGEGA